MSAIGDLETEAMAHLREFLDRGQKEAQTQRFYAYAKALMDVALEQAFLARRRGDLDSEKWWSDNADQARALLEPPAVASDAQK